MYRLRSAQGIVNLAAELGAERLDAACAEALAGGDPSYRTVKGVLRARAREPDEAEPPQSVQRAPAHLHGPERLFDVEAAR